MSDSATCPSCDAVIDVAIGLNTGGWTQGAVMICAFCRAIAVVDDEGTLRRPTDTEIDAFLTKPEIVAAIRVVANFHRQHGVPEIR